MLQTFTRTKKARILFFLATDIVLILLSVVFAFLLRFDWQIPSEYIKNNVLQSLMLLCLVFSLPAFYFFGLYSFTWAFVSIYELISLAKAVVLSFIFSAASIFVLKNFIGFPRSALLISYFLIFIFCGGIRFAKRIYAELFKIGDGGGERILIAGAGWVGEQVLRNILSLCGKNYFPIGFIDDDPAKQKISIHGCKVLGRVKDIPEIVKDRRVEEMIVAFHSSETSLIRKAVELGRGAGLKKIKTIPSTAEIIEGEISLANFRDVQIEDLLGRAPLVLETNAIENFIKNKIILVTGAAGSIGSELTRQVAKFRPKLILVLDQDETGIFNISEELKARFPKLPVKSLIADICDKAKINKAFQDLKPSIVFHAAAYKHVPLMEEHPEEAVKNNISGTEIIASAALGNGAEKFVFISTDKAVNPTSVMGATKRVGEMICQNLNQKNHTKFISVRFGNVLNSRGSVIPIFKEQIRKGGPVEVTHPEMKRYFMMISEAVLLVLQASQMGQGGEVFVLDMGRPVKILDLAREMIKLSGFRPDQDIPIVFTKPRPGEKLFEEILAAEEGTISTWHKKILKAKLTQVQEDKLKGGLAELKQFAENWDKKEIADALKKLVPSYRTGD